MGYQGDKWALVGLALVRRALLVPMGPNGLVPNGPGPHAAPWALLGLALMGRALKSSPGPQWASLAASGPGSNGPGPDELGHHGLPWALMSPGP